MAKERTKRYDLKIDGVRSIHGEEPNPEDATVIDPEIQPVRVAIEALETRCVKECCGLQAFGIARREIVESLSGEDLDALSQRFRSVAGDIRNLKSHSIQSQLLGSTVERCAFVKWLQHIADELASAAA